MESSRWWLDIDFGTSRTSSTAELAVAGVAESGAVLDSRLNVVDTFTGGALAHKPPSAHTTAVKTCFQHGQSERTSASLPGIERRLYRRTR